MRTSPGAADVETTRCSTRGFVPVVLDEGGAASPECANSAQKASNDTCRQAERLAETTAERGGIEGPVKRSRRKKIVAPLMRC